MTALTLPYTDRREHWTERARCRETATEVFFPTSSAAAEWAPARKVCAGCPVMPQCLAFALLHETPAHRHGMWGGLTPAERDDLVRRTS